MARPYHQHGQAAVEGEAARFVAGRHKIDPSEMGHSSRFQPIQTLKKDRKSKSADTAVRVKLRLTRAWDSNYSKRHINKAGKFMQHISSRRHQRRQRRVGKWRLYTTGLDSACLCRFLNTEAGPCI